MTISAGVFKAKCLKLMDEIHLSGREIVITKYGRPVAKLVPVETPPKKTIYGYLKNAITIRGDIVGQTGDEWDAGS